MRLLCTSILGSLLCAISNDELVHVEAALQSVAICPVSLIEGRIFELFKNSVFSFGACASIFFTKASFILFQFEIGCSV